MAARKRKKSPRRAQRSLRGGLPQIRPLDLAPYQVDVIALALVAVGVFLAAVAYAKVSGGPIGRGAIDAARFLFGALGYAVPAALVIAGGLLLARELRPPGRPLRTGAACLLAALTLALASGMLGLGPGRLHGSAYWHVAAFQRRGGILGQAEFWVASHLLSTAGAEILAVFLFLVGLLLVTGAGAAGIVRVTRDGFAGTTRVLRRTTEELTRSMSARASGSWESEVAQSSPGPPEILLPPEPDTSELVVRATHVEAPPFEESDASRPPRPRTTRSWPGWSASRTRSRPAG